MTYDIIKKLFEAKGYVFFTKENDLNMFGVRTNKTNRSEDRFDCTIGCAYIDSNGEKQVFLAKGTTLPGVEELLYPSFEAAKQRGTAILKEGQYKSAYQLGWQGTKRWKHQALRQRKPVTIYRDNNRDSEIDLENPTIIPFSINIHGASLIYPLAKVGKYSAGCQVIADPKDLAIFQSLWIGQVNAKLGDYFTYTLFNESDFNQKPAKESSNKQIKSKN